MKLLLDTHIILWTLDDNPKLTVQTRNLIMDVQNDIYYSEASVWETSIKHMAKPGSIHICGSEMSDLCKKMGYRMLPVTDSHVRALETLVYRNKYGAHNDPFDRILLAQAKADELKFVTHDSKLVFYGEDSVVLV